MNLFFSFLFPNVNDSVRNEHKKLWDCVAEDLQIADILHTVIDSETEEKALFAEMKYFYPEKEILEYRQNILGDLLKYETSNGSLLQFATRLPNLKRLTKTRCLRNILTWNA